MKSTLQEIADIRKTLKKIQENSIFSEEQLGGDESEFCKEHPEACQGGEDEVCVGDECEQQGQTARDIFASVREPAFEGMKFFEDNVDSEEYKIMKRIWLMTEKFMSNEAGVKDNDKNNIE